MSLGYKFTVKNLISKGAILEKDVETIKEFFEDCDEKLIPKCLPEELIATMLLSCSNDIDYTKKKIVTYFKLRKTAPFIFDNRNIYDDNVQLALRTTSFASINWPEENTNILYVRTRDTNYSNFYIEPHMKVGNMIVESVLATHPPDGIIIVHDAQGLNLMHITRLKFDPIKILFSYVQDGLPVKIKAFHYVNANFVVKKFMSILKLIVKPELFNKLNVHSSPEELADYIPKRYRPSEFGGELSSMDDLQLDLVRKLEGMETYWKGEEALRKQCFPDGK